jgi:hypothetical protein
LQEEALGSVGLVTDNKGGEVERTYCNRSRAGLDGEEYVGFATTLESFADGRRRRRRATENGNGGRRRRRRTATVTENGDGDGDG